MEYLQATLFGVFGLGWYNYIYVYFYNVFDVDPKLVPFMSECKPNYGEGLCTKVIHIIMYLSELPIIIPLYTVYSLLFFLAVRLVGQQPTKTIFFATAYVLVFFVAFLIIGAGGLGWHLPATLVMHFLTIALVVWAVRHLTSLGTRTA